MHGVTSPQGNRREAMTGWSAAMPCLSSPFLALCLVPLIVAPVRGMSSDAYGEDSTYGFAGYWKTAATNASDGVPSPPAPAVRTGAHFASSMTNPSRHSGSVLSKSPLSLYVIWYGSWQTSDKAAVRRFLSALSSMTRGSSGAASGATTAGKSGAKVYPLAQWWAITSQYTSAKGNPPAASFTLKQEYTFPATSFGSSLTENSTQFVVRAAMKNFGGALPTDQSGLYLLISAADVRQSGFCSTRCGFHSFTVPGLLQSPPRPAPSQSVDPSRGPQVPFLWAGNAGKQCPGFCGFPFKAPPYIPAKYAHTVKPPSGNAAMDALTLILAHELAEAATNPFFSGWFIGDSSMPTEIADLCLGVFGPGSFPGSPGALVQAKDGGAYNVVGAAGERFLLPNLWSTKDGGCVGGV